MSFATCDLFDAFEADVQVLTVPFRSFGAKAAFHGPVRTLKLYEDNALVRQVLSSPGRGAVLVVDGGGSLRTALMGDLIAKLACDNSWAGAIVWGAVRDAVALRTMDLGLLALGTTPRKSAKEGHGTVDGEIVLGGARIAPGHWVYADEDGVIVAPRELKL